MKFRVGQMMSATARKLRLPSKQQLKDYLRRPPKDFLYQRKGPWPQPCPEHPYGEAAGVIHLPWQEALDWWKHIGTRYVKTLFYVPVAYAKGIANPGLAEVTDEEFVDFCSRSMLARFLRQDFDDQDREVFQVELNQDHWIIDLEPVKVVKPFKGISVTASKTLLTRDAAGAFNIEMIYLNETDSRFYPDDGEAWELAKYFVLQGGALCSTLVVHPLLHFPLDTINAVTKTALPKDHLVFQLLYPHLRFTLYLEKAVLTFKSSLLQSKWWMPYAPYPGEYEGLRDLLVEGFKGISGNASYPEYKYPLECPDIVGPYGDFQRAYYPAFETFVERVLNHLREEELFFMKSWADYIAPWIPGFPKGEELLQDFELLKKTVTSYLFDVTVGHTVDHTNYGEMDIRKIPLRIRAKVPVQGEYVHLERKKLTKFWDYGKYEMARLLFFRSVTVTNLIDSVYAFSARHDDLRAAVDEFKRSLKQIDRKLAMEGKDYVKLGEIAASIQF